ncbi:hypothetical protein CBER1_04639 [Cercospora berteroae]|uniref:Uncharacterized protein n=1 Tax=Cercospora berteroae TaxID=357750 RepID=A0A2S6C2G9_9PEZI|nr:hypothetical protein CBER1_04639 [Cercospora berteroae]
MRTQGFAWFWGYLISCQVELVDAQNPFGDIASGEIVLYGHITPVILWGEAQNTMMAALERKTGGYLAFGDVEAETTTCILTRDIQIGDEVDFNDIPLKPDGSEDSPLHVVGVRGDKRRGASSISSGLEGSRMFPDVVGLLLQKMTDHGDTFSRLGWFSISGSMYADARFIAVERCNVRIL